MAERRKQESYSIFILLAIINLVAYFQIALVSGASAAQQLMLFTTVLISGLFLFATALANPKEIKRLIQIKWIGAALMIISVVLLFSLATISYINATTGILKNAILTNVALNVSTGAQAMYILIGLTLGLGYFLTAPKEIFEHLLEHKPVRKKRRR